MDHLKSDLEKPFAAFGVENIEHEDWPGVLISNSR